MHEQPPIGSHRTPFQTAPKNTAHGPSPRASCALGHTTVSHAPSWRIEMPAALASHGLEYVRPSQPQVSAITGGQISGRAVHMPLAPHVPSVNAQYSPGAHSA